MEVSLATRQKLFIKKYTSKYEKMGLCYKHGLNLDALESFLERDNGNLAFVHSDFHNLAKELIEKACKNYDAFIAYDGLTRDILLEKIK